jgi:hypothetical protein
MTKSISGHPFKPVSKGVHNHQTVALSRFAQHWIDNISLPSRHGFTHNAHVPGWLTTDTIQDLNVDKKGSSHAGL